MRKSLSFFLLLFCAAFAYSQQSLFEHFSKADGLPSSKVYDVLQGGDGNLWFATEKGICSFNGLNFNLTKVGSNPVTGLVLDGSNQLWCYNSNGMFYRYTSGKFSQYTTASFSDKIINSVYIDRLGNIYAGTVLPGSLYIIGNNGQSSTYQGFEAIGTNYYAVQVTSNGFVCGTARQGTSSNSLKVISQNKEQVISLSEESTATKSRFIRLKDNTYLYSNNFELIHLDGQKVLARVFLEKSIESICEDQAGKIWVGLYQGGAVCFPDGNINSASKINYLGKKTVSKIFEDNAGSLWFATMEDGIYLLDAMAGLSYESPDVFSKTNTKEVEEINQPIISNQTNNTEEGIATANKFRILTTDSTFYDSIPPNVYISGIQINDQFLPLQAEYEFKHNENFIRINYAGFSYSGSGQLQYKYRLEGLEEKWNYTNSTGIQYTTLPAGNYRFLVSAMNKAGIWSDSGASFRFVIHPPWWETWWFYTLSGVGLLLAVALVIFIWIRAIKKREQTKAAIAKQMAQLELQGLRAQMNPHFLFNTLSSIQHYITDSDNKAALKYLSKFAKLMRKIIDNSRSKVISIKDEVEALELYLELEKLRFKEKFDYHIAVDTSVDQHYDEIPSMLIQPYVENAILHGINHKTDKGNTWVNIQRKNNLLVCTVKDDGVGREAAGRLQSKTGKHKSQGMSITRERLQVLNKMHESNLSVNIVDLKDDTGRPTGTLVEIYVPLNNE